MGNGSLVGHWQVCGGWEREIGFRTVPLGGRGFPQQAWWSWVSHGLGQER